jgi:hypothetical protein
MEPEHLGPQPEQGGSSRRLDAVEGGMGDVGGKGQPPDGEWGEESGDPRGYRTVPHLFHRPHLNQGAGVETRQMGGVGQGIEGMMGDLDEREPLFDLEFTQQSAELAASGGVEMGEWFIQEHELRLIQQCPGEGDPGGFPTGKLRGKVSHPIPKADPVSQGHHAGSSFRWGKAGDIEGEIELTGDIQVGEQGRALGHPTAAPLMRSERCDVGVVAEDPSGIRGFETGDDSKGGGFAAAGGTGQDQVGFGGQFQGQAFEGEDRTEGFAELLEVERGQGEEGGIRISGGPQRQPGGTLESVGSKIGLGKLGPWGANPRCDRHGMAQQLTALGAVAMGGVMTGQQHRQHGPESGGVATDAETSAAEWEDTSGHLEQALGDRHALATDLVWMNGLQVGGILAHPGTGRGAGGASHDESHVGHNVVRPGLGPTRGEEFAPEKGSGKAHAL